MIYTFNALIFNFDGEFLSFGPPKVGFSSYKGDRSSGRLYGHVYARKSNPDHIYTALYAIWWSVTHMGQEFYLGESKAWKFTTKVKNWCMEWIENGIVSYLVMMVDFVSYRSQIIHLKY